MSEEFMSMGSVDRQNTANLNAVQKAQADLEKAVAASKKLFENNGGELHNLALHEDKVRFPAEQPEKTRTVDDHDIMDIVARHYDHEKYKDMLPFSDIELTVSQKASKVWELQQEAVRTREAYFGHSGPVDGEWGTSDIDLMDEEDIEVAREAWDVVREKARPEKEAAEQDLLSYYDEHEAEILANGVIIDEIRFKNAVEARDERHARFWGHSGSDDSQEE
jgi:hypothetical protein